MRVSNRSYLSASFRLRFFQLQDSLQIELTSLTHCESHFVLQQYGSCEQMSDAQVSQLDVSLVPLAQIEWLHELPPPPPDEQVSLQIELTSPTQTESHEVVQQYESDAHTLCAQLSHEPVSAPPVEQIGCEHVEPPPPPPTHTPAEQLWPDPHEPHEPPQPSSPHILPLQLGVHEPPPPPSAAPFGVPMPVGPSQPAPALHRMLPQLPFLPVVTSKNFDEFEYA